MKIEKHHLSQGVTLHIERDGEPHPDDGAWVEMPFGPEAHINPLKVEQELAPYGLILISPEEDEPEIISANAMRVWCRSYALVLEGAV